ncbi:MAG TPA: Dabb family protein [Pirellulales bacterium]|nr:Dabb family protein [Pirellulales bacterium]
MTTRITRTWFSSTALRWAAAAACVAGGLALTAVQFSTARAANAEGKNMLLVHNVFFSLKESNAANRKKLVDSCDKYLADHPGTVFYAAGVVSDLDRPVNDRDWDVGLHVIFKDRASHDAYQTAPKHLKFIDENKETWAKVRVFDTDANSPQK